MLRYVISLRLIMLAAAAGTAIGAAIMFWQGGAMILARGSISTPARSQSS